MQCPTCKTEGRKFGKDRYGNQRFHCATCKKTYSNRPAKPLDEMRLPMVKAVQVLKMLSEGCSVRSTVRLSGVAKGTVLALLCVVGEKVAAMMESRFAGLPVDDVQVDETWGFVRMKEKTKVVQGIEDDELGDAYCFVGIERNTKVIMAWHLGKRDGFNTAMFMENLKAATHDKRFQLTSDGFRAYPGAVELFLDKPKLDYAVLVKEYGKASDEHRYSPPQVIGIEKKCCSGNPDPDRICTSHVERVNLNIRMTTRRMTRLTNGFSKKWSNHRAALAITFAVYNFVRVHGSLKKTPAMAAGVTDHPWTIEELLTESTH